MIRAIPFVVGLSILFIACAGPRPSTGPLIPPPSTEGTTSPKDERFDQAMAAINEKNDDKAISILDAMIKERPISSLYAGRAQAHVVCSPKTGPGGMRVSDAPRGQETIDEATHA